MYLFLPQELRDFCILNREKLRELRIRQNQPTMANLSGEFTEVKINSQPCIYTKKEIEFIVTNACNNSFYKFNENIKNGYISCGQGIRMGISGECVCENGEIKTIKNFSSLCIRFPHCIYGCAQKAFEIIEGNPLKSLLVISRPGGGKTTLIRDLVRIISNVKKSNILLIDEKNEFYYERFDLGKTTDVLTSSTKKFGFFTAIKTMSPDVIVADELTCEDDANGAIFAALSGVKIICSIHGNSFSDVYKKGYVKKLIDLGCFEKFILLKNNGAQFETQELKVSV